MTFEKKQLIITSSCKSQIICITKIKLLWTHLNHLGHEDVIPRVADPVLGDDAVHNGDEALIGAAQLGG